MVTLSGEGTADCESLSHKSNLDDFKNFKEAYSNEQVIPNLSDWGMNSECQHIIDYQKIDELNKQPTSNSVKCNTCCKYFDDIQLLKSHHKSDWHHCNLKRLARKLPIIPEKIFNMKIKALTEEKSRFYNSRPTKGLSHLKNKDSAQISTEKHDLMINQYLSDDLVGSKSHSDKIKGGQEVIESTQYYDEKTCLFNYKLHFSSLEENLNFMKRKYNFFIKDEEYLKKKLKFIRYLAKLIYSKCQCITCNKCFSSVYAVQHHMQSCCHSFISSKIYDDLNHYFDFTPTYQTMIQELLSIRNLDPSKYVGNNESFLCDMQSKNNTIVDDNTLDLAIMAELGSTVDDSDDWQDVVDLGDGNQNLEKLRQSHRSGSDEAVIIYQNQLQAQEILRNMGLKKASITDFGNLLLPNGKEVINRKLAFIYRQRIPNYRYKQLIHSLFDFHDENRCDERINRRIKNKTNKLYHSSDILRKLRQNNLNSHIKMSDSQLRLGVKTNRLQKYIKRETKYFF